MGYIQNSPKTLLADVRDALQERYPTTNIKYDRLVVDVFFTDFTFEVQPVLKRRGMMDILIINILILNTAVIRLPSQNKSRMR